MACRYLRFSLDTELTLLLSPPVDPMSQPVAVRLLNALEGPKGI
jgi:hypothetical protein